jgi:hypothetical protein
MTSALVAYLAFAVVVLAAAQFEASYAIEQSDAATRRRLSICSRIVSFLTAAAGFGIVFIATGAAG